MLHFSYLTSTFCIRILLIASKFMGRELAGEEGDRGFRVGEDWKAEGMEWGWEVCEVLLVMERATISGLSGREQVGNRMVDLRLTEFMSTHSK